MRWSRSSVVVIAIALVAATPAILLMAVLAYAWCIQYGWPPLLSVPLVLAGFAVLAWWWCGARRQREWVADFAEPLPAAAAVLLPTLSEVQGRMGFDHPLELWLTHDSATNAYALGARHVIVTAGLVGEPPARQAAILAHELAHLRLGHAQAGWLLERCMFGYDDLVARAVAGERDSRWAPGSLMTGVMLLLGFTVFALPLLLLRVLGVTVGRRMEWEADGLAARHGYGQALESVLRGLGDEPGPPVELSLATMRARVRTHPPAPDRRAALRTGRRPRPRPLAFLRRVGARAARAVARSTRRTVTEFLAPPIDCATIAMAWLFADIGTLQTMIGGTGAGAPSLLPLIALTLRGRLRRPALRPRALRIGLALVLVAHAIFIVHPSAPRELGVAAFLDVAWLLGAGGVLAGMGIRVWLRALGRVLAFLFLPGHYAVRVLRSSETAPETGGPQEHGEPRA